MLTGANDLLVLGDYWQPDGMERSWVGQLVHRAKDHADARAAADLGDRFAQLAEALRDARVLRDVQSQQDARVLRDKSPRLDDRSEWVAHAESARLVVAVPPSSGAPGSQLSAVLAQALAEAGGGCYLPGAVVRTREGPRMRDLMPSLRVAAAVEAGYEVRAPVAGRPVVLVDDVILTGATLGEITARLQTAGAASVVAAVAARTRRSV